MAVEDHMMGVPPAVEGVDDAHFRPISDDVKDDDLAELIRDLLAQRPPRGGPATSGHLTGDRALLGSVTGGPADDHPFKGATS